MAKGFDRLLVRLDGLTEKSQEASVLVASQLLGDIKERVFRKGLDTAGAEIKNTTRKKPGTGYSKEPYFTNINNLINKKRAPKASAKGWINLPEGSKSFREFSGRQTNFVDLDYSSVLRAGLIFQLVPKGFNIGFVGGEASTTGGASVIEKAGFAEHRNAGPIFEASRKEVAEAIETYFEYIQ